MNTRKGVVFDIERYAIKDGPGVRTVIFLKGCNLRCQWCANPESQLCKPDIMYFANKCRGCGHCIEQCPQSAILKDQNFGFITDYKSCIRCGKCVDSCFYGARSISGKEMTVCEVMDEIRKDIDFYSESGGGVTFSGGEPFLQSEFLYSIAKACHDEGIETAVETCGYIKWSSIEPVLPFLDLVFFDVKHSCSAKHLKFTAGDNRLIIENLLKINENNKKIIIRIPYIPGFNDDEGTLKGIFKLAKDLRCVKYVEVLPYHRLGSTKYAALGRKYKMDYLLPVKRQNLYKLIDLGVQCGIKVTIGGE